MSRSRSSTPGENRTRCRLDLPARKSRCGLRQHAGRGGSTVNRNFPPVARPEGWLIVRTPTSRLLGQERLWRGGLATSAWGRNGRHGHNRLQRGGVKNHATSGSFIEEQPIEGNRKQRVGGGQPERGQTATFPLAKSLDPDQGGGRLRLRPGAEFASGLRLGFGLLETTAGLATLFLGGTAATALGTGERSGRSGGGSNGKRESDGGCQVSQCHQHGQETATAEAGQRMTKPTAHPDSHDEVVRREVRIAAMRRRGKEKKSWVFQRFEEELARHGGRKTLDKLSEAVTVG